MKQEFYVIFIYSYFKKHTTEKEDVRITTIRKENIPR